MKVGVQNFYVKSFDDQFLYDRQCFGGADVYLIILMCPKRKLATTIKNFRYVVFKPTRIFS